MKGPRGSFHCSCPFQHRSTPVPGLSNHSTPPTPHTLASVSDDRGEWLRTESESKYRSTANTSYKNRKCFHKSSYIPWDTVKARWPGVSSTQAKEVLYSYCRLGRAAQGLLGGQADIHFPQDRGGRCCSTGSVRTLGDGEKKPRHRKLRFGLL